MSIGLIDYGLCNLQSLLNAISSTGKTVELVDAHRAGASYDHMFIPGVGAFGSAMQQMNERGLVETVREHVRAERPLMGICLGMQLLVEKSVEFGVSEGLGLIAGEVTALSESVGESTLVPHIGWNQLKQIADWENTILSHLRPEQDDVYFVHSFLVKAASRKHCLATCGYGQLEFDAVIQKDNIVGVQFHPEKSAGPGLDMLKYFLRC